MFSLKVAFEATNVGCKKHRNDHVVSKFFVFVATWKGLIIYIPKRFATCLHRHLNNIQSRIDLSG